jgi:hypothetical protein
MEESGEQCTVVLAEIPPESASEGGGRGREQSPSTLADSVVISAKTTVHCSPGSSKLYAEI